MSYLPLLYYELHRMRYNVSFSDIEDTPVKEIRMITADISPAVGANLEFDVPRYTDLPADQIDPTMPTVQRLTREGTFKDLFKIEFFAGDYDGPDTVRIFRCVGHLHVAAIGMWLEDAITGETICSNLGHYGTDPNADEGFLNGLSVESFDVPKVISSNNTVRLVTEYDATILHTGVMGMWFLFIEAERELTRLEADMTVEVCEHSFCDATALPQLELIDLAASCVDELAESPLCRFAGICDCSDDFINAPSSTGCNGVFSSPQGDVPVNSLCQKSCGCPAADTTSGGCEDQLATHPACNFGGMCDCAELVNDPASTGCGGILETSAGDIVINEVCGAYCDECPEPVSQSALMEEKLVEQMEDILSDTCLYATAECRNMLNALYTCSALSPVDVSDGAVEAIARASDGGEPIQNVIRKHGGRIALEYAKLGHPSLHLGREEQVVIPCDELFQDDADGEDQGLENGNFTTSTSATRSVLWLSVTLAVTVVMMTTL